MDMAKTKTKTCFYDVMPFYVTESECRDAYPGCSNFKGSGAPGVAEKGWKSKFSLKADIL